MKRKRVGAPHLASEMWAGPPRPLTVAGVMSGTSADGIDVAICRISPTRNSIPKINLLAHTHTPYSRAVRTAVLGAMDASSISVADLSRLHWCLGSLYADAVASTTSRFKLKPQLISLHGQTIYHQATAQPFLGRPIRTTWQLGEPAVLRERLNIPVVSDFRPADLAAAGQGAPLVPMLDFCLFRSATRNRILLNLGGIANLTVIPAAGTLDQVLAFDTGPANMVIDALMHSSFRKPYDRNGAVAAKGRNLPATLATLLADPYLAVAPPKSCGREQFGQAYAQHLQSLSADADPTDIIATATEFTAASILGAYTRFCSPHLANTRPTDLIVSGGGTQNRTLMNRLHALFAPYQIKVLLTDDVGLPSQAKEATAFALLAWLTCHHLPGNIPSATGAIHPAILGRITP